MKRYGVFLGIAMVAGGLLALFSGITSFTQSIGTCFEGCTPSTDTFAYLFPAGLALVILGAIVWSASSTGISSGHNGSPFAVLGYFGVLGIVFFGLGFVMWLADQQPNADHTTNVLTVLGVIFGITGLVFIGVEIYGVLLARREARILASGIHGKATVTAVRDSNVTVNMNPMIALDMRVEIPGQPVFTKTIHQVISRLQVGEFRPGLVLSVVADPLHPRDIIVDWNGAAADEDPDDTDPVTGRPLTGAGGPTGSTAPTAPIANADLAAILRAAADRIETGQHATGAVMTPDELAAVLRRASQAAARAGSAAPSMPSMPMISGDKPNPPSG